MSEYLVTSEDLTAVADAIRAKSGGSESLEFPDGFVSEIDGIESGVFTWTATRTASQNFTSNLPFSEFRININGYSINIPNFSYGFSNKNAKLIYSGTENLTTAQMSVSDLFRQWRSFNYIDLNGIAPSSMVRWFYQWNYGNNPADPPIIVKNLSLDNLASQSGGTFDGAGTIYKNKFDVYFIGTLKNSIDLHSWNALNSDSWNRLIDCLYDYSEGEAHTLTLGSTIQEMIDSEHLAIATEKGWTIA